MKKHFFILILLSASLFSCMKGIHVDLIVHNAKIYTQDNNTSVHEAMAIRDGKVIEVGPERQILNKYSSDEEYDAQGKEIYPGFTNASLDIFEVIKLRLDLNLASAKSIQDAFFTIEKNISGTDSKVKVVRGLSELFFSDSSQFNYSILSERFSKVPLVVFSEDNQKAIVNQAFVAKLPTSDFKLQLEKQKGIAFLNQFEALSLYLPKYSKNSIIKTYEEIEEELLQYGITNIHISDLSFENVTLLRELNQQKRLKIAVYALLSPTEENINFLKKGKYISEKLIFRSLYVDENLVSTLEFQQLAKFCRNKRLQMHVIPKNSNSEFYSELGNTFNELKDHRWRGEAIDSFSVKNQESVINSSVFPIFNPTVQAATNFQKLYDAAGIFALGSGKNTLILDPFQLLQNTSELYPEFSLKRYIQGISIWAAFASFRENEYGSLEKGKWADFCVLEQPLVEGSESMQNYAVSTFIKGKKVYSFE